jgi:ferric-dicitrate binding protein FerR (iron transport regulator)
MGAFLINSTEGNMFNFLFRFRHGKSFHDTKDLIRTAENALKSDARRIHAIDPETTEQWRRLKSTLESTQRISDERIAVSWKVFLKPAFSFSLVCVLLVIGSILWLRYSSSRIYETAKGQHSTILLQDSSEITLNYLSELKVQRSPFEKARRVSLKGEALFHVRKNGTPFIITTDIGTVQVLGTQFNVRVRDEKMEVAVLSGSVRLSVFKDGKDSSIILTRGQISQCARNNYPGLPASLPFSDYPGWLQGKLTAYRSSLESVCRDLESQLDIKIKIENPRLSGATITGTINGQNPENALTTLVQLTGSKFRYEAGSYIIY